MNDIEKLQNLVLAPWIIKATALIGKPRWVGGNMFRHQLATMTILLDYKIFDDYVLLKAATIHDLIEDVPETDEAELRRVDYQGNEVVDLVLEVTRHKHVKKPDYLTKIRDHGSRQAKILKVADRISNVTDLHIDQYSKKKMRCYLDETEKYVLPMAKEVNADMYRELSDLVTKRRSQMNYFRIPGL